ncbi:hypothetical protein C8J56DRAFT_1060515 [Mycena floridula]|nr:hypothetical protein C8J56DRAFT_1060515 [Mycena floridula]
MGLTGSALKRTQLSEDKMNQHVLSFFDHKYQKMVMNLASVFQECLVVERGDDLVAKDNRLGRFVQRPAAFQLHNSATDQGFAKDSLRVLDSLFAGYVSSKRGILLEFFGTLGLPALKASLTILQPDFFSRSQPSTKAQLSHMILRLFMVMTQDLSIASIHTFVRKDENENEIGTIDLDHSLSPSFRQRPIFVCRPATGGLVATFLQLLHIHLVSKKMVKRTEPRMSIVGFGLKGIKWDRWYSVDASIVAFLQRPIFARHILTEAFLDGAQHQRHPSRL